MKRFRNEGRPIVYLDKSYKHSTYIQSQLWADESNNGLRFPISKGDRLIIIRAGGEKGFNTKSFKDMESLNSLGRLS